MKINIEGHKEQNNKNKEHRGKKIKKEEEEEGHGCLYIIDCLEPKWRVRDSI